MNQRANVSSHPENNGYQITGTVMNNVIDGEPIVLYEQEEMTTENILCEIQTIQSCFWNKGMSFMEYRRQLCNFERKYAEAGIIKSIVNLFPDDFDSRSFLYYFSFSTVMGSEPFEVENRREIQESAVFNFITPGKKYVRRASLNDDSDVLLKKNLLERTFEQSDNYYRGRSFVDTSMNNFPKCSGLRTISMVLTSSVIVTFA